MYITTVCKNNYLNIIRNGSIYLIKLKSEISKQGQTNWELKDLERSNEFSHPSRYASIYRTKEIITGKKIRTIYFLQIIKENLEIRIFRWKILNKFPIPVHEWMYKKVHENSPSIEAWCLRIWIKRIH